MIYGIIGWTTIGCVTGLAVRGHGRRLARLRDGLSLPKLMKGDVRVK
jgi:hypothetical protein